MPDILPIGSVVLLNGAEKKLMIIGLMQVNAEENRLYDYLAVPFPEGYINDETNYLFNHGDIKEVVFRGLVNDETQGLNDLITLLAEAAQENGIESLEETISNYINENNAEEDSDEHKVF